MKNWQGKLITFAQEPKSLESFLVLHYYRNPQAGFIRFVVLTNDGQQGCITINQADECIIREITYER